MTMFEKFLEEFPGQVRLDIYYAGEPMLVTPTEGFRKETGKVRKIPSAYVNGKNVASQEVPDEERVRKEIILQLKNLKSE
jgi:hypothetical protein